ncbi:YncE family protein [Actinomadura rudentiformis]|uniref:40-residue YVTN family beta-propeller repeat-containing protein n=1 Tax=Actinomadura rudentiformis TaxID=359158 RepID=A0A6H9YN72_9ACTN|nr:hypothetical protein [Actinomadura rudentiformis]KAB2341252.1 hypothetical protein F8566_41770 [Actinomadura rudentiformis]
MMRQFAKGMPALTIGLALCVGLGLTGITGTAHATGGTVLPLPDYADMVVDNAHKRLFVSGGPSSNAVVVTDFSGHVKKKLDGQYGATGMVLSADGGTLYVALAAGDAISAIDTEKLTETARYSTGARTCPAHLARTGSAVWFGYSCDEFWNGKIGRLDTAASPPAMTHDEQQGVRYQAAPYLVSAGGESGPVVAGSLALSLSSLNVYSVDGADLKKQTSGEVVGSNLSEIDLAPGGADLYSASGSRDHVEAFASANLAGRGSYNTGAFPNAVAAAPDGAHLATGRRTSLKDDIRVYKVTGSTPVKSFDLASDTPLAARGLAWSRACDNLFVITQKANGTQPTLRVVYRPTGW